MSNMQKPIAVPRGVELELADRRLKVKGPQGENERRMPDSLEVKYDPEQGELRLERRRNDRRTRAIHGLYWSLVNNMIEGVARGFAKALELHGMGYSVKVQGSRLVLQVGYSHEVVFEVPEGVEVEVAQNAAQPDNPAKFTVKGFDKEMVGQFAADVRAARPPEPYKGKGLRYAGEHVRRKEGKAFAGLQ